MSDPTTNVAQTPRAEGVTFASVVDWCTDWDPFCFCFTRQTFGYVLVGVVVFKEVTLPRLAAEVHTD